MSWLSDRLGTTGKTPAWLKKAGNAIGGAVVNAIPLGGGSIVDKLFNVTGTQRPASGTSGLQEIVAQTGTNLDRQVNTLTTLGAAQTQAQGLASALSSPMGLALIAIVAFAVLRKE